MKPKQNNWKTATIVLAIILLLMFVVYIYQITKTISINGIKINQNDFNQVEKFMSEHNSPGFAMCDMKTGECIKTQAIK